MKKTVIAALLPIVLFANEVDPLKAGQKIFDNTCSACHQELLDKKTALKIFKTLKAPPMNEVSHKIKTNIIIKDEDDDVHRAVVIAFIKDYIKNPDIAKIMCDAPAVEKFGMMPSQKAALSDQEINDISTWLYDRYEGIEF